MRIKKSEIVSQFSDVLFFLSPSDHTLPILYEGEEEGDAEVDGQEEEVGAQPGVEEAEEEE